MADSNNNNNNNDDNSSSSSSEQEQGVQYDDNDITLFRKIHPSEPLSRGRSILDVLYTRSIHGPRGMGGIKNSLVRKPPVMKKNTGGSGTLGTGTGRSRCTSPSSVILRRKAERAAANAASGSSETDSLEEVLATSQGNNNDVEIDSLSEVLNDTTEASGNANHNNNNNNSNSDDEEMQENALPEAPEPAPEPQIHIQNLHNSLLGEDVGYTYNYRHKMNAYPTNVSNEIINYVEQTSLVNFKADYLSLDGMISPQIENTGRRARDSSEAVVGMEERLYPNSSYRRRNADIHRNHGNSHNNHPHIAETEYAVSTISIAFSPDGRTVASTHGDHTVKISCCNTGTLIRSLEGHPRTPWTVKYHPSKSNIVASGCLGYQVRLWDWNAVKGKDTTTNSGNEGDSDEGDDEYNYHERKAVCLKMIRLRNSIISLSFHPTGSVLAIASGHSLHLWVYENDAATKNATSGGSSGAITEGNSNNAQAGSAESNFNNEGNNGNGNANPQQQQQQSSTQTVLHQIRYANNLRCVHFPPGGDTIIIGGHNNSPDATSSHHTNTGGDTCYSLLLLDFDLNVALMSPNEFNYFQSIDPTDRRPKPRVEVLKNYRTFLPRALLYNDGGFDVSRDGRTLCGCAELWLPFGVNSAAELIEKEEKERIAVMEHSFHVSETVAMSSGNNASGEDNEKMSASGEGGDYSSANNAALLRTPTRKDKKSRSDRVGAGIRHTTAADGNATETEAPGASAVSRNDNNNTNNNNNTAEGHVEGEASSSCPYNSPPRQGTLPPMGVGLGDCRTPPNPSRPDPTSPPSPPGRRWVSQLDGHGNRRNSGSARVGGNGGGGELDGGGHHRQRRHAHRGTRGRRHATGRGRGDAASGNLNHNNNNDNNNTGAPPRMGAGSGAAAATGSGGRYVPHVVVVSLDNEDGTLGKVLEATPLGSKASSVTCVKFSPSAEFCLLGYGVREQRPQVQNPATGNGSGLGDGPGSLLPFHPVNALYRIRGGMTQVATMLSDNDDVNIARFHPESGVGFVYGTKQGRVRVLGPRPWNYYYD